MPQELGAHADALFDGFERQATAAASLAQVHKAWLPDGTAVAVKVQVLDEGDGGRGAGAPLVLADVQGAASTFGQPGSPHPPAPCALVRRPASTCSIPALRPL